MCFLRVPERTKDVETYGRVKAMEKGTGADPRRSVSIKMDRRWRFVSMYIHVTTLGNESEDPTSKN